MSLFRAIPRAPQATVTSTGSVSTTSSRQSASTVPTSSTTSWDTRVGSPVYSTYPGIATQTNTPSDSSQSSSGGLLSSKPGVAGLCAGIAVLCILVAGFFIYRVKYRGSPKQVQVPDPKSSLPPPPVARPSKAPPSPFQLGSRARHPQQDGTSRSNSLRSQPPSNRASSRVLPSETGDVIEISPLGYQHTNSSITPSMSTSAYGFGRRRSGSAPTGQINDYHPHTLPSKSLERLSSATAISTIDSSSYNSQSRLLPRSQVFTIPYETKPHPSAIRPLPIPPIAPPAYELVIGAKSLQILSTIPDTENRSTTNADLLTVSTLSEIQSQNLKSQFHKTEDLLEDTRAPSPSAGPVALASHATTAETRSLYKEPAFLRRSRRSNDLNLDDVLENDNALDMENPITPRSHRRHHSSGDLDPFLNTNYELPAWLSSDPYPAQILRSSASQPSLYGATSRSAAASSRVLPSDSSIRTLTPKPTPPPLPPFPAVELKQYMKPRYSRAPTYATVAPSPRPRSAIVGDGPPVDQVVILHGAERPGWAENSPLRTVTSISRARRHFPTDGFEPEDLHPTKGNRRSDATISPFAPNHRVRGTDSGVIFVDATRISDPISGQGLSRAFSVDAPHSGRMSRSPGLTRTFSNFSSLRSSSQGARTGIIMSTFEGSGWLDKDRLTPNADLKSATDRGRGSMAPSSNVLPSEVASIRSISPEIGWIDPDSPHGHGHDKDYPAQRGELAVISESEYSESIHAPTLETPASTSVSGRASRMSIGEDGILWGRLTSAMEQEQQLLEQPS